MTVALEMSDVSKEFDGNRALDSACFRAEYGRVQALLGENGAGKSSLMNVVCGLYAPDAGRIAVDGVPVSIDGPAHARALGIGMVHQHFKLVRPFTVAENVALANRLGGRWTDELARVAETVERYCGELGFELDPASRIDSISVAERQRVEIVKVLMSGARILILDEPTAVLTDDEADRLLAVVRGLAGRGAAVVLITHKLREVHDFADRVTIMRAGRTVADEDPKTLDDRRMTELMVGSAPRSAVAARSGGGRARLEIADLSAARDDGVAALAGVTLAVQEGEIYGVAGVGGNGQTELAEVLMGVRPALHGTVSLDGEDRTAAHPGERRKGGLGTVPSDRYLYGLTADLSVAENFGLAGLAAGRYGSWWVASARMRGDTEAAIADFEIQGGGPATRSRLLSGGNAQKLVLARELSGGAGILVAHSPTRGLDVRACAAVQSQLLEARDRGAAVLLISEDLDEVLDLSDRVGVLNRGRIVGEFARPADRHAVGRLMVGHA
ncbi:MAG: ABC transporter ATP-binding protein [Defluviicoccus sp.]|nr:ABC transporter ATP-binding protein [Defluviicoccus sp.]MDE0274845.1 ABC transporter ATP-binding protein [Defluviicoccus sp.]